MFNQSSHRPHTTAVIVAAGSGSRMGGNTNKQFILIDGVPVLAHTLKRFDAADLISDTVVVCRTEDIFTVRDMLAEFGIKKVVSVVSGGATRQASVNAGIAAASRADIIAVHDGARPLVASEKIDAAVAEAVRSGAAALGVTPKDTIKAVDKNGIVLSTPPRSSLVLIQTPQVFRAELLKQAYRAAEENGFIGTDDCSLVERIGIPIKIIEGDYSNIKVTTPDDIPAAEALICSIGSLRENRKEN